MAADERSHGGGTIARLEHRPLDEALCRASTIRTLRPPERNAAGLNSIVLQPLFDLPVATKKEGPSE